MFNKFAIYRHFKGKLYLPLLEVKDAVTNKMNVVYMALYHFPGIDEKQSICSRVSYGEDGFFSEMPKGRDFYANEKMRMEEVDFENLYVVDNINAETHEVNSIELLDLSSIIQITSEDGDIFYIDTDDKESWNKYEIIERR